MTLSPLTGLDQNSLLYAGFLNQEDVTRAYRAITPYISNPFLTMGFTSRDIARRFTEFGGPSFFVSFLGQSSLNSPLDINVTFDSSLDWDMAMPEIAFWDVGMERESFTPSWAGNMYLPTPKCNRFFRSNFSIFLSLFYLDTGVWREVSELCGNQSRVDYVTFTIAVRVGGATTPQTTHSFDLI